MRKALIMALVLSSLAMYKVRDYYPEGGDWFWGKYGPDGQVLVAGKPQGCISCHQAVKDRDWLFTAPR